MAFLEIDEVAVNAVDLGMARAGDKGAKRRIGARLDGVVAYEHAFPMDSAREVTVTIRELAALGIINSIELRRDH